MSCFRFKKFTIRQENTAMKVGTDGVLLGAWANISQAFNILDIGTGSGVIALMAAQRNDKAIIDAVELDREAYLQAQGNVDESPWKERITLFHTSIFDFNPDKKYDAIICNPPFFIRSTKNPDTGKATARHCDHFFHNNLLSTAGKLLEETGNISMILPVIEGRPLIKAAADYKLYPSKITEVFPTFNHKEPKRLLIEFIGKSTFSITDRLVIEHSRHHYSKEYKKLTGDFYLHLM